MKYPRGIIAVCAVAALMAVAAFAAGCARTHTIVVYQTNNIQGHFWARRHASFAGKEGGGFAVLFSMLHSEQRARLLLTGGDWFSGTPEGTLTKGTAAVELMNTLGYSAAVPGASEFGLGAKQLEETLAKAKFPVLCANVYDSKKGGRPNFCQPYTITQIDGIKVGIIGLVSINTFKNIPRDKLGPLHVKNPIDEAKKAVEELSKKDVKFVIALTQIGLRENASAPEGDDDRALAAAVPSLGLIVSGRTNLDLARPIQVGNTYIIQSGQRLLQAGRMEMDISAYTGKILRFNYQSLPLSAERYGQDPMVLRKISEIRSSLDKVLGHTIGRAAAPVPDTLWPDSPLGNWTADCLRRWGHADFGLLPEGLLESEVEEGPISARQLYEIYPADDSIMILKVRGADIRQVLEDSLSRRGGNVFVGGAKIHYSRSAQPGKRITSVEVDGDKLSDSRIYRVAVPDRMVSQDNGTSRLVHAMEFANTRELVRSKIGWCMGRERAIRPPNDRRWLEKNDK